MPDSNGHYLLPQLMPGEGRQLVAELRSSAVGDLAREAGLRDFKAVPVIYSPVGGNKIELGDLETLAKRIREYAKGYGYPDAARKTKEFDFQTAVLLHRELRITAYEASRPGAWEFFTCILLPDLVRWRFHGKDSLTDPERFLGGIRNMFYRLWRRAAVLHDPTSSDPYNLLKYLLEDELVQITERPQVAADGALARAVVESFRAVLEESGVNREQLMRDAQKRLLRRMPVIAFDALDHDHLVEATSLLFRESAQRLKPVETARTAAGRSGTDGSAKGAKAGGLRGLLGRLKANGVGAGTQ